MIKVTVNAVSVRTQSGISKTTQKPYALDFQTVYVHTHDRNGTPHPYPERAEIILDRNDQGISTPYPVGEYTLAPHSVYIGRRGDWEVSPKLVPIRTRPAAA